MQRAVSTSRAAMSGPIALEIRDSTLFVTGPPIFDAFGYHRDEVSSAPGPARRFALRTAAGARSRFLAGPLRNS